MKSILDYMKDLGYRFSGTGGGRLYFVRNIAGCGQEFREFKSWDDVHKFVADNHK